MKKIAALIALAVVLNSCGSNKEGRIQKNFNAAWNEFFVQDFDQTKVVDVYVITNRQAKNDNFLCDDEQFGVNFSKTLKYGICKVSVPKNHTIGEIEVANENNKSLQNFFKVTQAVAIKEPDLLKSLQDSQRYPLVFVHGFNVRFQEAVLRAAQIAYDLKYQGPIVLYTWPAGSGFGFLEEKMLNKTYADNTANARDSVVLFKSFLLDLQNNKIQINLAVHSMGHQVVLPALKEIAESNPKEPLINQLVLNAPDFEVNSFRKFSKNLKKVSKRTTLYCSPNDKAMIASKTFNNNNRLGACDFVEDVDSINVGQIDDPTIGLGHGYYSSRAILGDVFQTLIGIDANKRLFIAKSNPNSPYQYFLRK